MKYSLIYDGQVLITRPTLREITEKKDTALRYVRDNWPEQFEHCQKAFKIT